MAGRTYLDHHTATRPTPSSVEALIPYFTDHWGSTVSPHQMGSELLSALHQGMKTIMETLGAKEGDRFYFFSSHAEAIHHLYFSHYFENIRQTGKNHIITTNIEEASVLMSLKRLEELGCSGKILPVNAQGQITKKILEEVLRPRTSLVSISWANGLTGVVHPVADIADACLAKGVCLHVDASYAIGKHYFRFEDLNVDYLTFDGSFLHSPKGTAGLLVKEKAAFSYPLAAMMGHPVGGIVALANALEENERMFDYLCLETVRLRDKLEKGIQEGCPEMQVLFQDAERLPNCSAIAFPGVSSDALLFYLNRKGVYASLGGGHCQKLSHVLVSSGIDETLAQCALSFSLSFETKESEIDYAVDAIVESARKLKALNAHLTEAP